MPKALDTVRAPSFQQIIGLIAKLWLIPLIALLGSCSLHEGDGIRFDKSLNYNSLINNSIIFTGVPHLNFPHTGLPDDYVEQCTKLERLLKDEFGIDHIVGAMRVRKEIGSSQYQQLMVSTARNGVPHWAFIDELVRNFPQHTYAIFLQPTPTTQFRDHLLIQESQSRGLQTISQARGSMRFILVNLSGLAKVAMDIKLKKAIFETREISAGQIKDVDRALTKPVLKIEKQWYPPYPTEEDLHRSIIQEFIKLLQDYR